MGRRLRLGRRHGRPSNVAIWTRRRGCCQLLVDPNPVLIVLPGNANRALPVPIPNQASLLGVVAYWQGAVDDPNSNALVTSNALTLKLGV